MVPANKRLCLKEWMVSEKSQSKRCIARLRADCNNASPPVRQAGVFLFKSTVSLDGSTATMPLGYTVPALSVVKASAWAAVANAELSVHWWGILVDD